MKKYYVDFDGVKTHTQFYEALIKGLEMPDWCGHNADAIWDLMTGYIEHPATVYVNKMNTLPKDLEREKIDYGGV